MTRQAPDAGAARGVAGRHFTQRGMALMAITMALALTAVVVTEFSTNTTVDMRAAMNIEHDMQAHFLARSAMNLSELVIRVQSDLVDGLNKQLKMDIQIAEYTGLFMGAFGGDKDEVESVAALLGAGGAGEIKGLGVPAGSFDIQITTDDGKINLNCANRGAAGAEAKTLAVKLQSLFYAEAYNPIFENENADGYRRDRNLQVEAIIDYIDRDQTRFDAATGTASSGAPEDYGYDGLDDGYKPRNYYLDSVGEIKLVRGIDDTFWNLFGNNFTIYGDCQENLTAITDPKQLVSIIALAAKNPDDPVLRDPQKIWNLALLVVKAREVGFYFSDIEQFRKFVTDPMGTLEGLGVDPSMVPAFLNLPSAEPIEGVELDATKLKEVVKTGARRTYRVEATATYDRLQKRIVGVWDTNVTRQNTRSMGAGTTLGGGNRGAWVFWREE
jgi:type II secretory pathway component PulK